MRLIVIIDENNGLSFNNRRQTQDSFLIKHMIEIAERESSIIWIKDRSKDLFEGYSNVQILDVDCFSIPAGDFIFLEDGDANEVAMASDVIYLYQWDKTYPSDEVFVFTNQLLNAFDVVESEEIEGEYHSIYFEKWEKGGNDD